MKRLIVAMLMSLMFLSGCILKVHNGDTKPIYPEAGYFTWPVKIDSLTPTFHWRSDMKTLSTYDFAIWDDQHIGFRMKSMSPIYYKEALSQPEHKIEAPLAPNTSYLWSVRTRSGGKVSAWATYDYYAFAVVAIGWGTNLPYRFKTPDIDIIKDEGPDMKTGQVKQ
jgi:hypothetical protein